MNAPAPARPGWRAALTNRAFVVHYLQMLAAMGIGMLVLTPFSMHLVHHAGVEVEALSMVTTMVAGTAVWMAHRLHSCRKSSRLRRDVRIVRRCCSRSTGSAC